MRAIGNEIFAQGAEFARRPDYRQAYSDLSLIQMVQDRGATVHFAELARKDESFRAYVKESSEGCGRYTVETGRMADIVGQNNSYAFQNDGKYDYIFVDPQAPIDTQSVHKAFLQEGGNLREEYSDYDIFVFSLLTNYVRSVNIMAVSSGVEPPLDIRYPNLDAKSRAMPVSMQLEDWEAVQERIEQVYNKASTSRPRFPNFTWWHPSVYHLDELQS